MRTGAYAMLARMDTHAHAQHVDADARVLGAGRSGSCNDEAECKSDGGLHGFHPNESGLKT